MIGTYLVVVTADDGNGGTTTDTFTWTVTNPSTAIRWRFFDVQSTDQPCQRFADIRRKRKLHIRTRCQLQRTDSFDYAVVDADGAVSTATVHLTVDPANDPPVLDSPIPAQSNLDADVINEDISGAFSDPDGDTMTFTASGLPPGLSLDPFTGEIFGTIDSDASVAGTYTTVVITVE